MSTVPTLPGITSKVVDTPRLKQHVLFSGPENGTPVLFIHGNASSASYWEEIMLKLPAGFRGIAPDLRGYGDTEDKLIDATRGMGDWIDDLAALLDALKVEKTHVVGHSMGGTIVFGLVGSLNGRVLSGTVVNPGSIYGFGGSKGLDGTPCYDDFAGSGGGVVNPDFPKLMAAGDRSTDNPQASPRVVMNGFYWKPPFVPAREEDLLTSLMTEKVGEQKYPGDFVPLGQLAQCCARQVWPDQCAFSQVRWRQRGKICRRSEQTSHPLGTRRFRHDRFRQFLLRFRHPRQVGLRPRLAR